MGLTSDQEPAGWDAALHADPVTYGSTDAEDVTHGLPPSVTYGSQLSDTYGHDVTHGLPPSVTYGFPTPLYKPYVSTYIQPYVTEMEQPYVTDDDVQPYVTDLEQPYGT